MNIYEKMAAITAELNSVAKNLRVGEGKSSYKAVGEADVLASVKPLEAKYKVYSYPESRRVIDSDVITTSKVYNGQESTSSKFFMRVETVYRFVNTEDPCDFLEITTYGDGMDAGDKAPGKAMTYGDKYALLKAYKIITGDDPDQNMSEDSRVTRKAEVPCCCESCRKPIVDGTTKRGDPWPAKDIATYTKLKYGMQLCYDCASKAASEK